MVNIGDKIETSTGQSGTVTCILQRDDGRYVILFKDRNCPHYCVEGDDQIKIIKRKK